MTFFGILVCTIELNEKVCELGQVSLLSSVEIDVNGQRSANSCTVQQKELSRRGLHGLRFLHAAKTMVRQLGKRCHHEYSRPSVFHLLPDIIKRKEDGFTIR